MDELKIELKDGYNTLKDIYYRDGKGSIFTFRWTKMPIIISSIFVPLSATFYFVSLLYPDIGWIFLMTICSLIAFVGLIFIVIRGKRYLIWKISVTKYLKGIRKYETYWLTLTDQTFEIRNIDETKIERWENIKSVSIFKDQIILYSSIISTYTLPEKSMSPGQFADLSSFIIQRMNDNPSKVVQVV